MATDVVRILGDRLEAVLDRLPFGIALIEPGTARVMFSNKAAREIGEGVLPLGLDPEAGEAYACIDRSGRTLSPEEAPLARAAVGERLVRREVLWRTPEGVLTLAVWTDTIPAEEGQPAAALVCFRAVTPRDGGDSLPELQMAEIQRLLAREQQAREAAQIAEQRLRRQLELNSTITNSLGEGVFSVDRDGRVTSMNPAAERMLGWSEADAGGLLAHETFHYLHADGRPYPADECAIGRVALTGTVASGDDEAFVRRDGTIFPIAYTSAPIVVDGGVEGAVHAFTDITERKRIEAEGERLMEAEQRARLRAEFLAAASAELDASLEFEVALERMARRAVASMADSCVIDLLLDNGSLQRTAAAHRDPEREQLLRELGRRFPAQAGQLGGLAETLRTRRPSLVADISDEARRQVARDGTHLELIERLGIRSAISAPLIARGRLIGALAFGVGDGRRPYDEKDLRLVCDLAARCALAVDNGRLYRERSTIAKVLQESLLPADLPAIPGAEIAARYLPAGTGVEVGGDFYDVFDAGSAGWAVVVGDVCGKGAEAAAITALARYTIRAAVMREARPSRVLAFLNTALLRQRQDGRFCTVAHSWLERDGSRARLHTSVGGHPPPILLRADGRVEQVGDHGSLLGVVAEPRLSDSVDELEAGDAVMFFTDGVVEARTPDGIMDRERLERLAATCVDCSAEEICDRIMAAIGSARSDDVALLVLRMTGDSPEVGREETTGHRPPE